MSNEIRNAVQGTAKEAQYDENAKKLLAQKSVLSHILVRTVDILMEHPEYDVDEVYASLM